MSQRFRILVSLILVAAGAARAEESHWIGTWATAPQPVMPGRVETFHDETLRLVVHVSVGGRAVRIRLSNTYGDQPLRIGKVRIARRTADAAIDPATDRALTFGGRASVTIPAHSDATSDAVDLEVPALSDLAISMYLPQASPASTSHALALQTGYVSTAGNHAAAPDLSVGRKISTWPFLTGVDVSAPAGAATVVAFGSSHTDGDGSTTDANQRWPDLLAARLNAAQLNLGVLNEGIIGNRLLNDSPRGASSPFGPLLGESGMHRFERDVLSQPGVKFVVMGLGVNDMLFPAFPFTPRNETVTADELIAGYRMLLARAHAKGVRMIGTTIPPFEGAKFAGFGMNLDLFSAERERIRATVNEWIRHGGAFDGVVDFDAVLRDPARPTRLSPAFAVEDGLHVNDAGNAAQAAAIPLDLFRR
jgi:lysophospholipase L1-like esterase